MQAGFNANPVVVEPVAVGLDGASLDRPEVRMVPIQTSRKVNPVVRTNAVSVDCRRSIRKA